MRKQELPTISAMIDEIKSIEKENAIIDILADALSELNEYLGGEQTIIADNFGMMITSIFSENTNRSITLSRDIIKRDDENNEQAEWVKFGVFVGIANKSKDWKSAYIEAGKVKGVSDYVADSFYKKFNPKGIMSSEESFRYFYNEVKKNEIIKHFASKK